MNKKKLDLNSGSGPKRSADEGISHNKPEFFAPLVRLAQLYLNSGVEKHFSRAKHIAVRNSNLALLMGFFTVVPYAISDIIVGDLALFILNAGTLCSYLFCFFLIRRGSSILGITAGVLTAHITIFLTSDAVGPQALIAWFHLPAVAVTFLIFEPKQRRTISFFLLVGIFFWFLSLTAPKGSIMVPALESSIYSVWVPWIVLPFIMIGITFNTYLQYDRFLQESESSMTLLMQQSKFAALGELAGGLAHEINNPLQIISGSVEALMREADPKDKMYPNFERILRSVSRVSQVTDGLIRFTQRSQDSQVQKITSTELVDLALALFAERVRTGHVKQDIEPWFLKVNVAQISLVLVEVIKAMVTRGVGEGSILVKGLRVGSEAYRFEVADLGSGSLSGESQGQTGISLLGLELSIIEKALATHQAKLGHDSVEGRPRFWFEIPCVVADAPSLP